jgi:uncharacterized membrane protein (UPF0182 family)
LRCSDRATKIAQREEETGMPWRGVMVAVIIAAIVLVTGLILLALIGDFFVDLAWFSSLGYLDIFWTVFGAKSVVFFAVFAMSATLLWANAALASRISGRGHRHPPAFTWQSVGIHGWPDLMDLARHGLSRQLAIAGIAGVLGALFGAAEVSNWDTFLRFLRQVPFGQDDPLYGKDIGFYLFSLPAYVALKNWMLGTLTLSSLFAAAVYWAHGDIEFDSPRHWVSPAVVAHGSALLAMFFAVKAWSYGLDRFPLLYGDNGVVVGASYTDIHIELPVLWLLIVLAAIASLLCWLNLRVRTYRLPIAALVLVFVPSVVLAEMLPAAFQRLVVKPNELQLEKPYIDRSITLTRQAYNLHRITVKSFPVEQNLTFGTLEANRATIDNIRLWDWQPLMDTYRQMQEIRTYYKFHDVDIDRYWLDGTYQAVMLSARELKSALLPANAQTWVNRHVLFTHGNGVIMSAVTRKSAEGLPLFYVQNIPPVATGGPSVEQPRIYFGEETDTYVIVKASTPEFDYPNGKDNVFATYDGSGGVAVGGLARRVLFSWYFEDLNILLSRYISGDSRIMFRRNIKERVRTIAPFLRLDRDPYIVISNGRLFWIQDAYTTSSYFPYAQPLRNRDLNYIRNAVKVVIDAYNGTVDFYLADPGDPIAVTYQRIFPGLFKPLAAMPADVQRHIRYPEDLFRIQAEVYRAYHMDSPEVFYNREDLWQFPRQPNGQSATMVPYYIVMRLPGEEQAEFFLMLPMVPSQRENMIAWLAARCDPPHYGSLIVYEFPKDKLVYGPFQIEARINQNTDISRQLSLWNQLGSRVIRGHLIVIPIENSILYVSPLYLRAETGQLPELKRVIAAYGEHVVMEETLAEALAALFREAGPIPPPLETSRAGAGTDRMREALDRYNRAIERMKSGDWAGFGAELDKLRSLLEEANRP